MDHSNLQVILLLLYNKLYIYKHLTGTIQGIVPVISA